MKLKILLLIGISASFCPYVASQTYNATIIDTHLQDIWNGLIKEEAKIASMMTNFIAFIQLLNSTLQPLNISQCVQFVGSFDYLVETLTDLATLANFGPYTGIASCSDVNQKITDIEYDIRIFREIIAKIYTNITELNSQNYYTTLYYSQCWYYLTYLSEKQQKAATVLSTTSGLISEYYNYINLLVRNIVNETVIITYLSTYKRTYCVCSSDLSTKAAANTSTLESNLQYLEAPLNALQVAIFNQSNVTLPLANAALELVYGGISPGLTNFISFAVDLLEGLVTIGDNYNTSYTGSTTSCADLGLRTSLMSYKEKLYYDVYAASARNYSQAFTYRVGMNATVVSTLSDAQLNATQALVVNMMILEKYMSNYTTMALNAYTKAVRMRIDIQYLGDTYCGCNAATTTVATTLAAKSG